jgi:hypothetical protein
MNPIIISIILFGVLLAIGFWWAVRFYSKLKNISEYQKNIPQEVINQFNFCERRLAESLKNGDEPNPYNILWEIYRGDRQTNRSFNSTEPRIADGELRPKSSRRENIQAENTPSIDEDRRESGSIKSSGSPSFWSRFKRRT